MTILVENPTLNQVVDEQYAFNFTSVGAFSGGLQRRMLVPPGYQYSYVAANINFVNFMIVQCLTLEDALMIL